MVGNDEIVKHDQYLNQCPEAEEKHGMDEQCNAPNHLEVAVLLAQEGKVSINILYQKNQRNIFHERNGTASSPWKHLDLNSTHIRRCCYTRKRNVPDEL
jgi:hypothetical protein